MQSEHATLFEIAVLAFLALEEIGMGKASNELPPRTGELDHFLANDVDDELWEKLYHEASKRKADSH